MTPRAICILSFLLLFQGCSQVGVRKALRPQAQAPEGAPKLLAIYEPWFGHPRHISVGYSSQDPTILAKQVDEAKALGISGFVVDWYGDREPFLDRAYALLQIIAARKNFNIAMMYDETEDDNGQATDDAVAALTKFSEKYLAPNGPGREAYLTYQDRPVIFIFPKGGHTDWKRVRQETDTWNPRPLLIYEDQSTPFADAFDGFYAWINPGRKGWAQDGSNWGEDYLRDFYRRMQANPKKIAVGAAWPGFDDRRAAWSLGRYISQRCGQTLNDTLRISRESYPPENPLPFLLIATWNDYEEGTAIERGLAKCDASPPKTDKTGQ